MHAASVDQASMEAEGLVVETAVGGEASDGADDAVDGCVGHWMYP